VAFGHDCVMDPWYPLGMGDQSQVAFVGAHAAQLLGRDELAECHRLVSDRPARMLGIESYGAREGQVASFLLVDAESRHDLLRRQARPWLVVSHGRIVARRERTWPTVELEPGRAELVRFGSAGN
jgi:cytosine deaminase